MRLSLPKTHVGIAWAHTFLIALFLIVVLSFQSHALTFGEPEYTGWGQDVWVDCHRGEGTMDAWSWFPFEHTCWYQDYRNHVSGCVAAVWSNSMPMENSIYLDIASFIRKPDYNDSDNIEGLAVNETGGQLITILDDGGPSTATLHISAHGRLSRDANCAPGNHATNYVHIAITREGAIQWEYTHSEGSDYQEFWTGSTEDSIVVYAGDEVEVRAECTCWADFTDVYGPWDELSSSTTISFELSESGSGGTASACCVAALCHVLTESDCVAIGGEWQEGVSSCEPDPCTDFACCTGEFCQLMTEADCVAIGGMWQETVEACEPDPCNVFGCCIEDSCELMTETDCSWAGGEWLEGVEDCNPDPCVPAMVLEPDGGKDGHRGRVIPNPVEQGLAEIQWESAAASEIHVSVYDGGGRAVRTMKLGVKGPGLHKIYWNCQDDSGNPVPRGIYFVRISTWHESYIQRVVNLVE